MTSIPPTEISAEEQERIERRAKQHAERVLAAWDPADVARRWPAVPEGLLAGLTRYIHARIATGDFLKAVLENNLQNAVGRADDDSLLALRQLVFMVYNEVPAVAWGSKTAVAQWLSGETQL